jgi:hypothetical protein
LRICYVVATTALVARYLRRLNMRTAGWCGVCEAVPYHNPPGSPMPARVLMEAEHGGFEIVQVDSFEDAQVVADALNLYAHVAVLVHEQEREDAALPVTR